MGIKDLPSPGIKFNAKRSSGKGSSFEAKLSNATRYGDLKNLRDNQKAIVNAVKKYQRAIRIGKFGRLRQRDAWLGAKKEDSTFTKGDRIEVKRIFKHLSGDDAVTSKTSPKIDRSIEVRPGGERPIFKAGRLVNGKIIKINGKKVFISNEKIKRNQANALSDRLRAEEEEVNGINRNQYAGSSGSKSSSVHGTMEDLGVSWNKKTGDRIGGFAQDFNKNKMPDNPSSSISLGGGKRPIGL